MSNAKRRHRRRRRHRLSTEWWHVTVLGRVCLFPANLRRLQRNRPFLRYVEAMLGVKASEWLSELD